jgi:hypothetical protein
MWFIHVEEDTGRKNPALQVGTNTIDSTEGSHTTGSEDNFSLRSQNKTTGLILSVDEQVVFFQ